jgi:hypothetical protein
MDEEIKVALGLLVRSNLAMMNALLAVGPGLPEEQGQQLVEALDTLKNTNQAVIDMLGK